VLAFLRRQRPVGQGRPARSSFKLGLSVAAGFAIAAIYVTRPLTAPLASTVDMADMTWLEVRAAVAHGYTTVIVPSGGIEQNGPHMVLGKHDYIVRYTADRIAMALTNTLVAPTIPYVPEGDVSPPTGNMQFPGTIGVAPEAFASVLDGIARSLKSAGFKTICFIADHGQSQAPQNEVASRLTHDWQKDGVTVLSVSAYYDDAPQMRYLTDQGETRASIGNHAGIIDTSELLAVHPDGVDLHRFADMPFTFAASGGDGDPMRASAERGKALLQIRVDAAVRQIKAALATQ
jgi:creatinine amidohydrolase